MKKYLQVACLLWVWGVSVSFALPPKNVIVLIGDGMGFEQVKAAGMYAHGAAGTLSFESLPFKAQCSTYSANNAVTDSAAAATAIATGQKVNNDVISVALPGNGSALQTLLEYFKAKNKSTGLVTTTYISHATPAGFGAHESSRNNYANIVNDYLTQTKPNILMGGASYISPSSAAAAGYTVVTTRTALLAVNTNSATYLSGQFSSGDLPYEYDGMGTAPHLSEMTVVALDILDNDMDGFFLMVEGGKIDKAGHSNDLPRNIGETLEFSNTVQAVLNWAAGRTDTLVIVTADHETGGLTVLANNGQGVYPTVTWSTTNHTGVNVPVYAAGVNAEMISGTMDNTDFYHICTSDEIPADRDGDSGVDLTDFSRLSMQWQNGATLSDLLTIADAWLSGVTRFALRFDGVNDYIKVDGYTGIGGTTDRTCAAWIKTPGTTQNSVILNWGGQDWIFGLFGSGELTLYAGGPYIKTTMLLNDNQWHHVATVLTDDGTPNTSEIKLYVDGVLQPTQYSSGPINTPQANDVLIGAFSSAGTPAGFFKGLIDDVRIYDRALSESELIAITDTLSGLAAHWKMDEGAGTSVEDSAAGHTGTLYGTSWSPGK